VNAPLRRVGVVVLVLFALLFANLNWVQAYKADEYRNSDYNGRVQVAEYERERGVIEAGRTALATSKPTDGELKYVRQYPFDETYAHVVGYNPVNLAATGIEKTEDEFLAGTSDALVADRISDLWTGEKTPGGSVLLSLSKRAQETAFKEMTNNRVDASKGAAVALDPKTGAVQALVSMPSFDPNPLVSHDTDAAEAAYDKLEKDPNKPLINRALGETYPPGSTFKVIDTAAALESGYTKDTKIPAGSVYRAPTSGTDIRNAAASICPESEVTLGEALTESCNTGFAQLAGALGADKIKDEAKRFGFGQTDLTCGRLNGEGIPVAPSETGDIKNPDGGDDPAALAQSGIGQNNVRMTPMQGAMIAATVANNGKEMRPYLVQKLLGPDRTTSHYTASPKELNGSVISGDVAGQLRDMMVDVVKNGTGKNAQINDFVVGGKTGTAQSAPDKADHGWFIGFAMRPDGTPVSAVAVFLQEAGPGGSAEAARIGGQIMRAVVTDAEGS
jgi:peptidoglycan glycosyltransferase